MKIKPFLVEEWMNAYETQATYNIAETCADSISLEELFTLCEEDLEVFWKSISSKRLTYGDIHGYPSFREGASSLYRTLSPEQIIPTHGAAGANHLAISALVNPNDHIISVMPTYQQLYSIPESIGAEVDILKLTKEDGYQPDLNKLESLLRKDTRAIILNNPNNPTGALMSKETLLRIVALAEKSDAFVFVDEVYRHLVHDDTYSESIVDLYDKGVSTSSMSKVFSLAGIRLGWIAVKDEELKAKILSHRDYSTISCGMIDERIGAVALKDPQKLLKRNRDLVKENLSILTEWVEKEPLITFVRPQAGTTALLHYDLQIPSREFCLRLLDETGAFLTPGDCFGEEHSLRIGYASDTEVLRKGLEAMSGFIKKLQNEQGNPGR